MALLKLGHLAAHYSLCLKMARLVLPRAMVFNAIADFDSENFSLVDTRLGHPIRGMVIDTGRSQGWRP